ncbi:glycoside hydrolase family 31 protein [Sphingobacterium sp. WM]|uniref:glycoside hydrolase family 31 protein n=1 Tax=Sphingobacterium sp. WM TaxID=3031802 RepID=UPI00240D1604|nr:glycoside hydrolase family 31 protein [Sphingobacterium sp. WM]WFB64891.1 glycoside hydrolase family 31 protein [Sphingobacterium sp. WM]
MADTTKKGDFANDLLPNPETLDDTIQHVNNPVLDLPNIEKLYLTAVKGYSQEANTVYFTDGKSKVEVKVYSEDIIRIRLAPEGSFLEDFSYAISFKEDNYVSVEVIEDSEYYKVKTNTTICLIRKSDFNISFSDMEGQVLNRDHSAMHWEENVDFGGYYVYCTKEAAADEAFFGLGDKATNLNLRGKRVKNWNSDTYSYAFNQDPLYKTIPFYIGVTEGKAYGIFFDNTFKTYFDFAAEHQDQTSFWSEGGELQYYYIQGPKMMDVVKRYHKLTGTHYMPAMWGLGYHQCRWSYYPENKVREVAYEFRKREIPCDAIYLDIDYMDGYRCFTWNKRYFPDPKKMISDLNANGFKTVVMIDPGIKVDDNYWVFKQGKDNNYFCRRGDDYFMEGFVWPGRCQFPDFTNPEVRTWWGTLYKGLVDDGVAGFWNDMNEPAVFGRGTFPNDVRHQFEGHRGSHRKAHNVYGMQMVRATYDGLKKLYKNKRPFTITRAAYAGTQRYSSVWTGDNIATWEHLRIGTLQLQRLSVSGLSFCGTDIGGFTGEPDGELYTRWMQFGVFSPFMRVHSAGDTRDREPWSFGPEWEAICKKFIELRYKLLPYIYSTFWLQHKYGEPILRPIAMLEQEKAKNMIREEEFGFGNQLLVSPVLHPGQANKIVYLPEGTWYYYFDNTYYEGGQEYTIDTPLDEMPFFVRGGSIIPEYPVMQFTGERRVESLRLNLYYAEGEHTSSLYSDHGETFAYEQGVYVEKHFITTCDAKQVNVIQGEDGLYTPYYTGFNLYLVGLPFEPKQITVDGNKVSMQQDDEGKLFIKLDRDFKKINIQ